MSAIRVGAVKTSNWSGDSEMSEAGTSDTSTSGVPADEAREEVARVEGEHDESLLPPERLRGPWLRNAAHPFASVRAWDNTVCPSLCVSLEADAKRLDASSLPATFWLDASDQVLPECSLERFVRQVLRFHTKGGGVSLDTADCGRSPDFSAATTAGTDEPTVSHPVRS